MRFCPVCHYCYENYDTVCVRGDGAPLKDWPQRKDPSQESWVSGPCQLTERYRLIRLISSGGMGTIFEGVDKNLDDRPVAIKTLHRYAHLADPDALERFRREARAASRVNHANVAVVHDYGVAPEWGTFIVMELIGGENLAKRLKAIGRLPVYVACQIAQQIAYGIGALHGSGFVHRDLKPSNVIITFYDEDEGLVQIKVVDFGIVKAIKPVEGDEPTPTNPGLYVGTPSYMSPEHCANKELDARSDIYSLGLLLFEMVAGRKPFVCKEGEDLLIFSKHLTEQPPLLREFRPEVPEELERLVDKALKKDPSERPQSAYEFARALRAFTQPDGATPPSVRPPELSSASHREPLADSEPETQTLVQTLARDESITEPEMQRIADRLEEGLKPEDEVAAGTHGAPGIIALGESERPLPGPEALWEKLEQAYRSSAPVRGRVTRRMKRGLLVELDGIPAFLPGSQVDTHHMRNLDGLIGQEVETKIINFDRECSNVVLSCRALHEERAAKHKRQALDRLEVGDVVDGLVKRLIDYGAFVSLGGVDGLLHVSEMSWIRPKNPTELLKVGDAVKVKVLKIDRERGRISLSRKQLLPDPWQTLPERVAVGSRMSGRVCELSSAGAHVEIEEGLIGLVQLSEITWARRISDPAEVLTKGQEVNAVVTSIEPENRLLLLSIKNVEPNPWEAFTARYGPGDVVRGKVARLVSFGAFVELTGGLEGLCHITQLSERRVERPEDVVRMGHEADFRILQIDPQSERVYLSIRADASTELFTPAGDSVPSTHPDSTSKVRVYDLAKDLRVESKQLIEELRYDGLDVSLPSNTVSREWAERIRNRYFPKRKGSAPHAVRVVRKAVSPPQAGDQVSTQETPVPVAQAAEDSIVVTPPDTVVLAPHVKDEHGGAEPIGPRPDDRPAPSSHAETPTRHAEAVAASHTEGSNGDGHQSVESVIQGTVVRRAGGGVVVDFGFAERLIGWDKFIPQSDETIVAPTVGQRVEAVVTGTDSPDGFTFLSQFRALPLVKAPPKAAPETPRPAEPRQKEQPRKEHPTGQAKVAGPEVSGCRVLVTAALTAALIVGVIVVLAFFVIRWLAKAPEQSPEQQGVAVEATAGDVSCAAGSKCVAVQDAHLRVAPGKFDDQGQENESIGVATEGSLVEILEEDAVRKNWRRVRVVKYGRRKNPKWQDEGWIDGGNLRPAPDQ